jgi:ribosomal protein L37AE/L43A
MTFPRERNGWVDKGEPLSANRGKQPKCPNCGSDRYRESISLEICEACGLRFDYWGGGGNDVYEEYLANNYASQEREQEEQENYRWRHGWDNDDE